MTAQSAAFEIVVTHPIHSDVRARLEAIGRVRMNEQLDPWSRTEFQAHLASADAMIGFMTDQIDETLLASAPRLQIVACALKGFDSYDVAACTRAGVWVSIVPDLLTEPTAELAIGLAISLARNVPKGDQWVRRGHHQGWRAQFYGVGLSGAVITVIGLGQVGQAIIQRLSGFSCQRIIGIDPKPLMPEIQQTPLELALAQSDFVFVAAPLTAESRLLLNRETISRCKPGQFIINIGRGSVVDELAIADALDQGLIAGYGADVFAFEDWGLHERPTAVPPQLCASERTLLTPHLGSAVGAVRRAIEHRAADNVIAVLSGDRPPDAVNTPVPHKIRTP